MQNIITEKCIKNIFWHANCCWAYGDPTGSHLEWAIYQGLSPFYDSAKRLGHSSTIVDVGKEDQAFDVKGSKTIRHVPKLTKGSNHIDNNYVLQKLADGREIYVKVPKSISTFVRRPKVNLNNYLGNPKKAIDDQVLDYETFARETTKKDGYKDLYSLIVMYGHLDVENIKSVFISIKEFEIPVIARYEVGLNGKNTPKSYLAYDADNKQIFSIESMNAGSSNFIKRFDTSRGYLVSWVENKNDYENNGIKNFLNNCTFTTIE